MKRMAWILGVAIVISVGLIWISGRVALEFGPRVAPSVMNTFNKFEKIVDEPQPEKMTTVSTGLKDTGIQYIDFLNVPIYESLPHNKMPKFVKITLIYEDATLLNQCIAKDSTFIFYFQNLIIANINAQCANALHGTETHLLDSYLLNAIQDLEKLYPADFLPNAAHLEAMTFPQKEVNLHKKP